MAVASANRSPAMGLDPRHLQQQHRQQALTNLLGWLETAQPDVVCLQELKCEDKAFAFAAIEAAA